MPAFFTDGKLEATRAALEAIERLRLKLDETGRIWWYDSGRYSPRGETALRTWVRDALGDKFRRNHVEEVIAYVKNGPRAAIPPAPPEILCVANGNLNLRTGLLEPHSPHRFLRQKVALDFDPTAACPQFQAFLRQVLSEDAIPFVQEMIGYGLVPQKGLRTAVLFLGDGRNGKSTLVETIRSVLGYENASSRSLHDLAYNRFAAVDLEGKLANLFADLDDADVLQTGIFKALVGGDVISVERKHEHPFQIKCDAVPIFSANRAPLAPNAGRAYADRWIVLPFQKRVLVEDPDFLSKLTTTEELRGILAWAARGAQRLLARGRWDLPPTVKTATDQYRASIDPVGAFLRGEVEAGPDLVVARPALYARYESWAEELQVPVASRQVFFRGVEWEYQHASLVTINGAESYKGIRFRVDKVDSFPIIARERKQTVMPEFSPPFPPSEPQTPATGASP